MTNRYQVGLYAHWTINGGLEQKTTDVGEELRKFLLCASSPTKNGTAFQTPNPICIDVGQSTAAGGEAVTLIKKSDDAPASTGNLATAVSLRKRRLSAKSGERSSSKVFFSEAELPLNLPIKVQLTNWDTFKHFGVVRSDEREKRDRFLNQFHLWHKLNKASLKLLYGNTTSESVETHLGAPCVVNSLQVERDEK